MSTPPKPAPMPVQADSIPESLKTLERWTGWAWRLRNEEWDKPPLRIGGGPAKSNDPKTWTTFENAFRAHQDGKFDGIGITFGDCGDGRNLAGVDLDDVIINGQLASWAHWVIGRLDTYCEISPSGSGIKFFCWGTLPRGRRNGAKERGVEMYDSGRYFTVTGRRYPDTNPLVMDRMSVLQQLHPELLGDGPLFGSFDSGKTDRERAVEYLKFVPPAMADNYQDWVAVGMILRGVADDLLSAWEAWSQSSSKYKSGECEKKWRSFSDKPGGLTLGTLGKWAKENGWQSSRSSGTVAEKHPEGVNGHAAGTNGKATNGKPSPGINEGARQAGTSDKIPLHPLGWLHSYGVEVDRVIKIGDKRGVYDLLLKGGHTIQLGTVAEVLTPRAVQCAIADAVKITIPEMKRLDWRCIGAELIRIAEHEDVGADPQAELRDWIYDFASTNAKMEATDDGAVIDCLNTSGIARTETGIVYVGLTKFLAAITGMSSAKITRAELIQRLYREGFKKIHKQAKNGSKHRQSRCWESGKGYYETTQN